MWWVRRVSGELEQFQKNNGLDRTARLDGQTMVSLLGNIGINQGSSRCSLDISDRGLAVRYDRLSCGRDDPSRAGRDVLAECIGGIDVERGAAGVLNRVIWSQARSRWVIFSSGIALFAIAAVSDQVLALATGRTQQEIASACKGVRPNHVGAAISRHKRAGRIEERDGKLYARQATEAAQHAAV